MTIKAFLFYLLLMQPALALGAEADPWHAAIQPLLQQYCCQCHNPTKQKGDLNLQQYVASADGRIPPAVLEEMSKRLVSQDMPPAKAVQPAASERGALVAWIRHRLAAGQESMAGDPGRVVIPHLTPTQYEHVIADLTGMHLPLASQLPREGGAGEGFDNVGASQSMTTMHIQAYLTTAMQVATHARILPGMPLEWKSESSTFEARSAEELFAILSSEYLQYVERMWSRQVVDHIASLKSILPTDAQWATTVQSTDHAQWAWLIVYFHAAWQFKHRAELGHPDWSPADIAAAYQPPLRKEILTRLVAVMGAKTWNAYWREMVSDWDRLPPPPVSDVDMRTKIFHLMAWRMQHIYVRNHDTAAPPETPVLLPIEVDPRSYQTQVEEPYTVMMHEGRRPFRFKLGKQRDLYLVTTDAGDGSDDDIMIWEHGVITRDGHDEPWTGLDIRDRAEHPVAWGSHPMGPSAGLPLDSIAVHAPAVLHLTFPAGTTAFRVDARADPVYAKNGSMQAVPFMHPPTDDDLHFAVVRYIFGAPGSSRQHDIMAASELLYHLNCADPIVDPWNLLPPALRGRWGNLHDKSIPGEWTAAIGTLGSPPPLESVYGANFPHGWPGEDALWKGTSTFLLAGATDAEQKGLAHLTDKLFATIEARDTLAFYLVDQKVHLESPAQALTIAPTTLGPDQLQRYQHLLDAARTDEQRLVGCAREQITAFATRAWRCTPSAPDVADMLTLYQKARDEGLCYEASMKQAVVGILISPYFLYRSQPARQRDAPYALDGQAIAGRLASVIWGSIPDAELLQAGADGQLSDPAGLRHQIARMVADRRSQALAAEFAGQMFLFAGFDSFNGPDLARFPEFTPVVRACMLKECLAFFSNLFTADRPLTDIIEANYIYVNQDLASYYGIGGVDGPAFRKISVDPAQRGGILGMGAFLVSTSLPLRTSPIRRGNWVLTHLLGTPPPPPPPVVPQLSHEESNEQKLTIVQQMKLHRSDARCMSCHELIDPLGISLESFDAIGRHRTRLVDGSAINEQEETVDGTVLQGFSGLKKYLSSTPQQHKIIRNLCEKFTGYALGRGLIPSDQDLIDHVMEDLAAQGWRSSVLIQDVLTSPEFTQRRDQSAIAGSPSADSSQEKP
jgi:hypothetical protein